MDSVPRASVADLAYTAGYVDGEGCIYFEGSSPCIKLETCNPLPLKFISNLFGGTIYTKKRTGERQTKRTVHVLRYYGDNCMTVVKMILPYMREKKDQAEHLIEIRTLKKKLKESKRTNHTQ